MSGPKIKWWRTSFGEAEVEKLRESVLAEHISQGPVVEQLEEEIARALGVPYAVVTTSGSAALYIALLALGIGPGDEVLVPSRTWIATAHAALLTGATVRLVDVRADTPNIDVDQVAARVTARTRAIMPVHVNGRSVDMGAVNQLAREHGLLVVEDACQAMFSRGSGGLLGTQSDVGCFSLGVTKLISTGQGGFVVTSREDTHEKLKLARNHGVVDNFTDSWSQMGFNFKFTDLLASFGLVQLGRVSGRVDRLGELYSRYEAAFVEYELPYVKLIPVNTAEGELPLYVEVLSDERDRLAAYLGGQGIQVRPFAPSLHTSDYLDVAGAYPRSEVFAREGMYLPCGPEQPLDNVDRVMDALAGYESSR